MLGFEKTKPVIGMVHLKPLPGSAKFEDMEIVMRSALRDTKHLIEGGVDGILIENYGDMPFSKKVSKLTISAMSYVISRIEEIADIPIGVNVLRNDWEGALSIAKVFDLDFIRVNVYTGVTATEQGIIEGNASEIQKFLSSNDIETQIFADIDVKHGSSIFPKDIERAAEEGAVRGNADALILSGSRTGEPVNIADIKRAKKSVDVPILVGSGLRTGNIKRVMQNAQGAIVGTSLKEEGGIDKPVSLERVKDLMEEVESVR